MQSVKTIVCQQQLHPVLKVTISMPIMPVRTLTDPPPIFSFSEASMAWKLLPAPYLHDSMLQFQHQLLLSTRAGLQACNQQCCHFMLSIPSHASISPTAWMQHFLSCLWSNCVTDGPYTFEQSNMQSVETIVCQQQLHPVLKVIISRNDVLRPTPTNIWLQWGYHVLKCLPAQYLHES
jgi:hypothetical protein